MGMNHLNLALDPPPPPNLSPANLILEMRRGRKILLFTQQTEAMMANRISEM